MWDGSNGRVARRHVFFVAGYHPMAVDDHFRLFVRELERFGMVWSLSTRTRDDAPRPTATGACWQATAAGPDWTVDTRFEILAWDDLARADMERPLHAHVAGSLRAVWDMVASGTLAGYFRASRRYGLFFVFTYLVLAGLWALAALAGAGLAGLLAPHAGAPLAVAVGALAMIAAGLLLLRWPGRRLRLRQSLDLAEFSVDFARGRHPAVEERVRAFARRLAAVERAGGADEIVVAGHSLGAMHAVSAVAHALAADPAFGRRHVPVRILTLGSTTAKFALHPAGARFRDAAAKVAAAPWIGWLEIQSRDDMVSFYKVNPVTLDEAEIADRNTAPGDFSARPLVRHAAIRDMLTPESFARFRFDVMRLHCQCFLASDKRAHHDFYAYVAGPVRFDLMAATTSGLADFVGPDGGLKIRPRTEAQGAAASS